MMIQKTSLSFALSALFTICAESSAETVKERLAATPYHLVYEKYADNNWELFVSKADGTGGRNGLYTTHLLEHIEERGVPVQASGRLPSPPLHRRCQAQYL